MSYYQRRTTIRIPKEHKAAVKKRLCSHGDYPNYRDTQPDPVTGETGGRRLQSKDDILKCADYLSANIDDLITVNGAPATAPVQATAPDAPQAPVSGASVTPVTGMSARATDKQRQYIRTLARKLAKHGRPLPAMLSADLDTVASDPDMTKQEASLIIGQLRAVIGLPNNSHNGAGATQSAQSPSDPADDFDDETETNDDTDTGDADNVSAQTRTGTDNEDPAPVTDDIDRDVSALFAKFASGDFDGFRRDIAETMRAAREPKGGTRVVTITKTVDANGCEIAPAINPQFVDVRTAADLWPKLPSIPNDADKYGFECFDYSAPYKSDDYDMSGLHATGDLQLIAIAAKNRRHVWLAGEKGTGKTSFCRALAQSTGRPFFRIQHFATMESLDLLGSTQLRDGATVWQDGLLVQAIKTPHAIVLLDEPTLSAMACQMYQTILDEGYVMVAQTGERVQLADGVMFFVADNTLGNGDDTGRYDGVAPINNAGADRYAYRIDMHYLTAAQESKLLVSQTGINKQSADVLTGYAQRVRNACQSGDIEEPISFRRLLAIAEGIVGGADVNRVFDVALFNTLRQAQDREAYRQLFNAHVDTGALAR